MRMYETFISFYLSNYFLNTLASEDLSVQHLNIQNSFIYILSFPLIFFLYLQHPNLTILVADDGEFPSWTEDDDGPYVKYFRMPYDSGLSAGRNLMLSQVITTLPSILLRFSLLRIGLEILKNLFLQYNLLLN
jgi:hypothetical protein